MAQHTFTFYEINNRKLDDVIAELTAIRDAMSDEERDRAQVEVDGLYEFAVESIRAMTPAEIAENERIKKARAELDARYMAWCAQRSASAEDERLQRILNASLADVAPDAS